VQEGEVRRGLGVIASLDRGFLATLGGTLVMLADGLLRLLLVASTLHQILVHVAQVVSILMK
jgi:hypothetical protein